MEDLIMKKLISCELNRDTSLNFVLCTKQDLHLHFGCKPTEIVTAAAALNVDFYKSGDLL